MQSTQRFLDKNLHKELLYKKIKIMKNGCVEWTGCKWDGYGVITINKKKWKVHRLEWFLVTHSLPKCLDHLCRNRACINVNHLEPVTLKENILRGFGPPAINARKKLCPKGHSFSFFNYSSGQKGRCCRKCAKERSRKWRKKCESIGFKYWLNQNWYRKLRKTRINEK